MCTLQTLYNVNPNFMITNLVLSKEGTFTCKQVLEEIRENSLDIDEMVVKKALDRLRDNDYLEETGYSYRVIPLEESVRWGYK